MVLTEEAEAPSRNQIRYMSATDLAERDYYDGLYVSRQAAVIRKSAYDYNQVGRAARKRTTGGSNKNWMNTQPLRRSRPKLQTSFATEQM